MTNPSQKKTGLVKWLKVKALSSIPSIKTKKKIQMQRTENQNDQNDIRSPKGNTGS
jgi:hypothetical protein